MHVLPVLIICEVEFGIGEWIQLCMNGGVSHQLDFLMYPCC